jgi:hypothetical protein
MCFGKRSAEFKLMSEAGAMEYDENDGRMDNTCYDAPSYRVIRLKEENEKLRRALICKHCNITRVQTLNLPCAHIVCCEACADLLDNCPLCNEKILGTARIFVV